jgi:two-component system chemotaxis sensor kinase CheA
MTISADDEILQDFLVEAGEILEQLNEELVDLEQRPDDYDLLNAVFRGFHTIKGGAGFLNIENLVEVCHRAEDVFNVLRQGQRAVDPNLMDAVLQVLDVVNGMFDLVRNGEEPAPADRSLIAQLQTLAQPAAVEPPPPAEPVAVEVPPDPAPTPQELPAADATPAAAPALGGDDISDEEFEALLDQLHGQGKHGGVPETQAAAPSPEPEAPREAAVGNDPSGEEITDEEFEALLDQLHGQGRHKGVPGAPAPVAAEASSAAAAPIPEIVAAPRPAAAAAPVPDREEVPPPATKAESKPAAGAKPKPAAAETTVRVDTQRLDDIMNMVGELVLVRNRLSTLKAAVADEALANAVGNLDVVTADLQVAVMKTRMQPIKKVFGRFPRVVRDLARSLNKEVDLEMIGEETDLDKNLVEALADPLVHLVRNAVDHGIETPGQREQSGKTRRGRVVLSADQEGDHIVLSIEDDGRGMDAEVLRSKAVEKGMMDAEAAARLDDKECYNLIFAPGFSTKTEISDVSGRGVGMDVVKTRIAQMNGQVEIDSRLGKGSKIVIKLPLTLAIMPTLMVVLGQQPFALPLASVVEIFNLDLKRTNVVDGQLTIRVRERALPLFYLRKWLVKDQVQESKPERGAGHVVVVNVGNIQVGLVVDYLVGQEEVVIKPLGALLQGLKGMAGATITGDGKIALILDVPGLMRKYARRY